MCTESSCCSHQAVCGQLGAGTTSQFHSLNLGSVFDISRMQHKALRKFDSREGCLILLKFISRV